jgi:hypothetical protein
MSTDTVAKPTRRPFSKVEQAILALHVVALVVVTVTGWIGANDPGWSDLQRIVLLMLAGVWAGGIALTAVLARLVNNKVGRLAVLLVGPLAGLLLIIGQQYLV